MFQQMRGKGMAQGVGRQLVPDTDPKPVSFQDFPEPLPCQWSAQPVKKQHVTVLLLQQDSSRFIPVPDHPVPGRRCKRHQPLLAPLTKRNQETFFQVQVVEFQAHQFRNPQARGIQQFHHRLVPQTQWRFHIRQIQQGIHLTVRQILGQQLECPGTFQDVGGIFDKDAFFGQKPVKVTQCGTVAHDGAGRIARIVQPGNITGDRVFGRPFHCCVFLFQKLPEPLQIAPIGVQCVPGKPFFNNQIVEKPVNSLLQ